MSHEGNDQIIDDTLTGITEIFGPILERLETLETKMSKIEKEKL